MYIHPAHLTPTPPLNALNAQKQTCIICCWIWSAQAHSNATPKPMTLKQSTRHPQHGQRVCKPRLQQ